VTAALIIFVLGLAVLLVIWAAVRGQSISVSTIEELEGRTVPVDLEAFRNLVDPDEDRYLRQQLAPADFRRVQRQRKRAAIEYLWRTVRNAAVLLRLGEAARLSPEPAIQLAGSELANAAILTRVYSLTAIAKLYVCVLFPALSPSQVSALNSYERLRSSVERLGRLQQPVAVPRISTAM